MQWRRFLAPMTMIPMVTVTWTAPSHAQGSPPAGQPAPPDARDAPPPLVPPDASVVPPPEAKPPPPPPPGTFVFGDWKLALHGLAGASFYVQDTPDLILNGQGPLLALAKPSDGGYTTGADIRQTRFNFSVAGPKVLGATPKAVLEIDLFGLNSPGGYGEVSAYSRTRLAYAELNWGNDVLRFGQDHQLLLGVLPEALGHVAFPVTYPNGMIGWREPGLEYFHTIPLDDSKFEIALQVMKSDWNSTAPFSPAPQGNINDLNVDYGQLSGYPGVEARVKWSSEHFTVFAAGHYNHVMATHAGELVAPPTAGTPPTPAIPPRNWDVFAGQAGLKLSVAGLTLSGGGYVGQNTAPLLGELFNFIEHNDVGEWGAWGQVGYDVVKELNISVVGGTSQMNKSDVEKAAPPTGAIRLSSAMVGGMIRYKVGGFALGPEFYHLIAKDIDANGNGAGGGPGATNGEIDVNQGMLSGMYFF